MKKIILLFTAISFFAISCKKTEEPTGPKLIFKFRFDSTQTRLDNLGRTSAIVAGNAGQSPVFHGMSAHYIELAPDSLSPFGVAANILYKNNEVTTGGDNAIDFSNSIVKGEGEVFYSVPLKNLTIGTYKWLRISLAYQNYDIKGIYRRSDVNGGAPFLFNGEVASFLGFNTYITSYTLKGENIAVNANRLQGSGAVKPYNLPFIGTMPAITWAAAANQSTTVVNPFATALGIPAGSCLVTGKFTAPINITGNETTDIIVTVSLSTNKSFEWFDKRADGIYEPVDGLNSNAPLDSVVDMGIRGMIPVVN
jgi:hypothetical protein